jgi:hypothetical protein
MWEFLPLPVVEGLAHLPHTLDPTLTVLLVVGQRLKFPPNNFIKLDAI